MSTVRVNLTFCCSYDFVYVLCWNVIRNYRGGGGSLGLFFSSVPFRRFFRIRIFWGREPEINSLGTLNENVWRKGWWRDTYSKRIKMMLIEAFNFARMVIYNKVDGG